MWIFTTEAASDPELVFAQAENAVGTTAGPVWIFTTTAGCVQVSLAVHSVTTDEVLGSRGRRFGLAVVTIIDDCGQPVEGAVVTGHFTGDFESEPLSSATTDALGRAEFMTIQELKKPTFSFVVDEVTHLVLSWSRK